MTAMSPGRLTIGALAAVILLCALAAGVHGTRAQAPAITIEGGSFEAAPDSAFAFEVTGESPHYTIGAFSISVTFDPDVLAPVSCQSHDARCDRGDGEGEVVMNNISLAGWTGEIHFGTVVFQAVGGARSQTPIDLTVTTISDTTGSELDRVTDETDGFASIDRDAPDHPLGDANCDLRLDPLDGLALLVGLAGLGESGCFGLGDLNCDDRVDSRDTLDILRVSGGLPVRLPPGCPSPE